LATKIWRREASQLTNKIVWKCGKTVVRTSSFWCEQHWFKIWCLLTLCPYSHNTTQHCLLFPRSQSFKSWIALSTGWITIQWITQLVSLTLIHWMVIYPVDSATQLLNNQGQVHKWVSKWRGSYLWFTSTPFTEEAIFTVEPAISSPT